MKAIVLAGGEGQRLLARGDGSVKVAHHQKVIDQIGQDVPQPATIVKGFSLTLALGVAISLFTAIYVTRTLLTIALRNFKPQNLATWFGI